MITKTTENIFLHAYDQASPYGGEGWGEFTKIIHEEMSQMEALLRQVLPDWADEVEYPNGCKICAEITEKDVVMIRDFLKTIR